MKREQVRAGRVDKADIASITESSGASSETVYAVLWAVADQGYELVKSGGE